MRRPQARPSGRLAALGLVLVLLLSACDLGGTQTPTDNTAPPTPADAVAPGGSAPGAQAGAGAQPAGTQAAAPPNPAAPTAPGTQAVAQVQPTVHSGDVTSSGSIAPAEIAVPNTPAPAPTAAGAPAAPTPAPPAPAAPTAATNTNPPSAPAGVTSIAIKENLRGLIAFIALDNHMWLMPSNGKNARRIIANPAAPGGPNAVAERLQWSPSGRRLLYTVDPRPPGQSATLYVWDADSGRVITLGPAVGNPRTGNPPTGTWLPDSNQVAIARPDGTVAVRDIAHGTDVNLGPGSDPAWMPPAGTCAPKDALNSTIAVVRDNNLWLVDYPPHQGGERQLTKYPAPGGASWAVGGTTYLWDCRALFYGDPNGGLGAQGNGQAVYGVNLVTSAGGDKAIMDRGGRIQMLAVSPDGRDLALTEDDYVNACIAAGAARIATIAGQKVADLSLPMAQQGYHPHVAGLSWAPRGDSSLVISFNQNFCDSADPATLHSPIGPRLYLYHLNALDKPEYIGDGTWPAWNGGVLGLGLAPGADIAAR